MLIGALAQYFFGFTIFVLSTFLVLLVLVQRGRGGGLTGALGGPGGQSAFGTKAGDLFTRITVGVAAAWILLCASAVFMLRNRALPQTGSADRPAAKGNSDTGMGASSGTTGTNENTSSLPKFDPSNLTMPKLDLPSGASTLGDSTLGDGTTKTPATNAPAPATKVEAAPATDAPPPAADAPAAATEPPAAPPASTAPASDVPAVPASDAPAATEPPAPATTPEPTPPASAGTETPPAPK